jgi:DNA invertase Pin-like site-specific DNA recombinase
MLDMIPNSLDDLNRKIQGFVKELNRPDGSEMVGIYTRVSRIDHRAHGYSLDIQPDRSEEYAKSKGWQIYQVYEDPARTGRNSRRPELQHMINDIKAGRITIVVVHRLDRLYRNLESLLRFLRMIKRYRVRLVSVTEQIDTDNWWGRLVLYVLGALAEMYIWQSSARTREAKLERVMRGLSNASFRFGYCNGLCSTCTDPNGKDYCPQFGGPDRVESQRGRIAVPHPVEAHGVRMAANLYAQGKSDLEVADNLNRYLFGLPDGSMVHFRTKGLPNQKKPGAFSRDSIRVIIRSPYYVGLVAHYPTRPLDMEDDPENPKKRNAGVTLENRRNPQVLTQGVHEPLYPVDLWKRNMQRRQARANTPTTEATKHKHEYLLSGIGRCWVCYEHGMHKVGLRGSQGGSQNQYYGCAVMLDKRKGESSKAVLDDVLDKEGVHIIENRDWRQLVEAHTTNLRAKKVEAQIDRLISQFSIPESWYETIIAYYLSDDGMAEFERESYNLRQELNRAKELYSNGFISLADFQEKALTIGKSLETYQPSSQPEAREIVALLKNFPKIWADCNVTERKKLLKVMFLSIYFDPSSNIRLILAHEPFDHLLPIKE